MGDSFYERPPAKDTRYARNLVKVSNSQITTFIKQYSEAREKNDCGFYEQSNFMCEELFALRENLEEESDDLPLSSQQEVARLVGRLQECLDSCPFFPPPIMHNPSADLKFRARQTSSDVVAPGNRDGVWSTLNSPNTPNSFIGGGIPSDNPQRAASVGPSSHDCFDAEDEDFEDAVGGDLEPGATAADPNSHELPSATVDDIPHRSVSEAGVVRRKVKPLPEKKLVPQAIPTTTAVTLVPGATAVEVGGAADGLAGLQRDVYVARQQEYVTRVMQQAGASSFIIINCFINKVNRHCSFDFHDG